MRKSAFIFVGVISVAALTLSSCGQVRRSMGYDKRAPDEFSVASRAPLTIPPEFNLEPPKPGAQRPQEASVRDEAKSVLIGDQPQPISASSPGQETLLRKIGADKVDPNIRDTVDSETTAMSKEDKNFTDKLVFWRAKDDPSTLVDAEAETQRLRENQALGDAVTTGETPSIKRKQKGFLEGIFN